MRSETKERQSCKVRSAWWEEWSSCGGKGEGVEEWKDVKRAEKVQVCIAAPQEARALLLNVSQG